jgi:hypothetical protein
VGGAGGHQHFLLKPRDKLEKLGRRARYRGDAFFPGPALPDEVHRRGAGPGSGGLSGCRRVDHDNPVNKGPYNRSADAISGLFIQRALRRERFPPRE